MPPPRNPFGVRPWKTSAIYSTTRVVEFALAVLHAFGPEPVYSRRKVPMDLAKLEKIILEYVGECEHGEGTEYWDNFPTLSDALEDFGFYLDALD